MPSICIYEVFKRLLVEPNGEELVLRVVATMQRGQAVELDTETTLDAAKTSRETRLPMADSLILATARAHDATVWIQDSDFKGLAGVEYVEKG